MAWTAAATRVSAPLDALLLDELARLPGSSATWAEASSPGDTLVAFAVLVAVALGCLGMRAWRPAVAAVLCTALFPLVYAVKGLIERERPETDLALYYAMPSGHSASAVVAWGAVALLLVPAARRRGAPRWLTPLAKGTWLGLAFAVGVARVAAGVHWPTDVLAGWAFGGLVLAFALAVDEGLGSPRGPQGPPGRTGEQEGDAGEATQPAL